MKKIALYRCMFGNYDFVIPDFKMFGNIDYYLFTDNPSINIKNYKTILVKRQFSNASLDNRYIKIILPRVLYTYSLTIYMDMNIQISGDILILINRFINSSSEIGLFSHPYKNSIEDEVALCLSKKKCNENDLKEEIEYYSSLNIEKKVDFITDNSIIFRKKHSKKMTEAMLKWFDLVKKFSGRDQISFPIIRELFNFKEYIYSFSPRTKNNGYFTVLPHKLDLEFSTIINVLKVYAILLVKRISYCVYFIKNIQNKNNVKAQEK